MRFQCPACEIGYRLPVRVGQQVRCARCNHVWRVSQEDFIEDQRSDENGMPEEFSETDSHDAHDESAMQQVQETLSSLLDRGEYDRSAQYDRSAPGSRTEDIPDEAGAEADDQDWPVQQLIGARDDEDQQNTPLFAASSTEAATGDGEASSMEPEPELGAQAGDEFRPSEPPPEERSRAGDNHHRLHEASDKDLEEDVRPEQEIADNWFRDNAEELQEPVKSEHDEPQPASFERIMEGIEEVISEAGEGDASLKSDYTDYTDDDASSETAAPLRALLNGERERRLHNESRKDWRGQGSQDVEASLGNVVHFTAPGTETAPDAEARGEDPRDSEDRGSIDKMFSELSGKLGEREPDASRFADDSEEIVGEDHLGNDHRDAAQTQFGSFQEETRDAALDDVFASSQLDNRENAAAVERENAVSAEGYEQEASTEGYEEEAYEAAQRPGLARDPEQRDPFDHQNVPEDPWREEVAGDYAHAAFQEDQGHYDDPQASAPHARADDDMLLAEYEFGEDEELETQADNGAKVRRRWQVSGFALAAAWAVFLVVMAAAGASVISFREQVSEVLPAAAGVYEALGFPIDEPPLTFVDVTYEWSGTPPETLTLKGSVKNTGANVIEVPPMQITIRDDNENELLNESEFIGQASMVPGQTVEFSVNVRVPAEKLKTVELAF